MGELLVIGIMFFILWGITSLPFILFKLEEWSVKRALEKDEDIPKFF